MSDGTRRPYAAKLWGDGAEDLNLDDPKLPEVLSISDVTLASANDQTKAVSCNAQFSIDLPPAARARMLSSVSAGAAVGMTGGIKFLYGVGKVADVPTELSKGDGTGVPMTFGVQPTADGTDSVLSINDPQKLEIAAIWAALALHSGSAVDANAAASPPQKDN